MASWTTGMNIDRWRVGCLISCSTSSSTVVRRSARLIAAATLERPGISLYSPGHHPKMPVTTVNVESMSIHVFQGSRV